MEHVLDPLPVGLLERDVHELRPRAGRREHALGEADDRDALLRADVVDLARVPGRAHQPGEGADRVLHVAEAARLVPVAEDLEPAAAERGADEARDHHPVAAALARADGVEEADDHAVEPALLVVGEREELVHRLRVGVGPAALRRRPVDAAGALVERRLVLVVAVDLRGRGDQDALAEAVALVEHVLGALHVRHERAHRLLDDQAHADGRGEVVDDVALVDELVHDGTREHRVHGEVEIAVLHQVLDVPARAGGEVVEDEDLLSVGEQQLCEVRADEPGPARDQRLHEG